MNALAALATVAAPALPPGVAVEPALYLAVQAFEYRYARVLDALDLDGWVDLFTDACSYRVLPRENAERALPLGLINCDSKGMLKDRVKSLREANIYNIHWPRRIVGNVEILAADGDTVEAVANYVCLQTDQEGQTRLYSTGQYQDLLERTPSGLRLRRKTVLLDTFNVPNLLAIPL